MRPEQDFELPRLELKYLIAPQLALAVRDFVSSYLVLDPHGEGFPELSYPIHNLYLDSDDLKIYWGTINGNRNRFKLRLRCYANNESAPVYFEIKRRVNHAILKQRCAVRRTAVEWILAGHLPEPEHLATADPGPRAVIQRFIQLMAGLDARPRAHVTYRREAWLQPEDNSVRVTLDRAVRCTPQFDADFRPGLDSPATVFGSQVVLELKFTGRFPTWFGELVQVFGLWQCAAAKYADGVLAAGEQRFSRGNLSGAAAADPERHRTRRDASGHRRAIEA